jgi:DNA (cytosine-5)-methyltransferase 1
MGLTTVGTIVIVCCSQYRSTMSEAPRVVDLFCGGGGFSEGFRRAGFDVVWANDIDSGACETYELNHPDTEVLNQDIADITIEQLPDDIDVLIGSPPCTEFSYAKNGGGGDIDEGMRLVGEFLRFVVELDVDYWVMENVPRLDDFLEPHIGHDRIPTLDSDTGVIDIPQKEILDSSHYGTPQRRHRLFSGRYPMPSIFEGEAMTLGELQDWYPKPLRGPRKGRTFDDPLHGIQLEEPELSDHFYNTFFTDREAEEIRVRKEDHSYYGRMSFPEDRSKPSRTVLATNRRIARETLVLEEDEAHDGFSRYRKPTIREIASIQGFPITYQFTGRSVSKKWRRVGDAVPPPVAYAIASEIRREMSLAPRTVERTSRARLEHDLNDESFERRGRRKLSLSRSFRHHVPMDNIREFRVDIETDKQRQPRHPVSDWVEGGLDHPVAFRAHFYHGYAKEVSDTLVDLEEALGYLRNVTNPERRDRVVRFLEELNDRFGSSVPDTTTVQASRSRRLSSGIVEPAIEYELLERVRDFVDEHFPSVRFGGWTLRCEDLMDGIDLPGRVMMKLVAANYVAWKMNHGARWIAEHPDGWYLPEEKSLNIERPQIPEVLEGSGFPDRELEWSVIDFADSMTTEGRPVSRLDD